MGDQSVRIGVPLLAALISASLAGCGGKVEAQKPQAPAPTVEIVEVSPQDTAIYAEYPGQTYARDLVEVRGRVDGYIDKWLFRPGQTVKSGQPLYELDRRPYQAQVEQAQGAVRQAEADAAFAREQVSLIQAQANLEVARSGLVKAQQDYERLKPLVEQDAAARQDLDTATAALRSAESNVRASEATVQQAKLNTQTQIQSTQGKLETQKGTLRTATLNLEYGIIRAPISGIAGDTLVPVGGLVTAGAQQPLTTIVPLDPMWVRFKLSEGQYLEYERQKRAGTQEGPTLELFLADNTKLGHAGRIENSLNQVDPRTGTLEVQARFPNPEGLVLPGQFGRVRFVAERRQGVLLVPQRAVQQNQSIQSLYVLTADNKIEARSVKPGARVGDQWIIDQGLQAGDRVVVEGLLSVRPGMTVSPRPFHEKLARSVPAGKAKQ
jgi:membrane fusion protein (multidrug efflux system)